MNGMGTISIMLLFATSVVFYLWYGVDNFGFIALYNAVSEKGFQGIWDLLVGNINLYILGAAGFVAFISMGYGVTYAVMLAVLSSVLSILMLPFNVLTSANIPEPFNMIVYAYFMLLYILALISFFNKEF